MNRLAFILLFSLLSGISLHGMEEDSAPIAMEAESQDSNQTTHIQLPHETLEQIFLDLVPQKIQSNYQLIELFKNFEQIRRVERIYNDALMNQLILNSIEMKVLNSLVPMNGYARIEHSDTMNCSFVKILQNIHTRIEELNAQYCFKCSEPFNNKKDKVSHNKTKHPYLYARHDYTPKDNYIPRHSGWNGSWHASYYP